MAPKEVSGLRVKERREQLGLSQEQLAKAVGVTQQAIAAIEAGRVRKPRFINELAKALGLPPSGLAKETPGVLPEDIYDEWEDVVQVINDHPIDTNLIDGLLIAGIVEAGSFKSIDIFPLKSIGRSPIRPDLRYDRRHQLVWQVRGAGMELLGIEDGMYVTTVLYENFVSHYGPIRSGTIVVVEHRRAKGTEREISLKEAVRKEQREGMIDLYPRSRNPAFKLLTVADKGSRNRNSPLPDEPLEEAGPSRGEEVEILAVVLSAHRLFSP